MQKRNEKRIYKKKKKFQIQHIPNTCAVHQSSGKSFKSCTLCAFIIFSLLEEVRKKCFLRIYFRLNWHKILKRKTALAATIFLISHPTAIHWGVADMYFRLFFPRCLLLHTKLYYIYGMRLVCVHNAQQTDIMVHLFSRRIFRKEFLFFIIFSSLSSLNIKMRKNYNVIFELFCNVMLWSVEKISEKN